MAITSEIDLLRQIPLFAGIDRSYLQVLVFSAERVRFKKGEIIIKSGEQRDAAYLILQGQAAAYSVAGNNRAEVAAIEQGGFIGQMAMLAGLPHNHEITAIEPVDALSISRQLFYRVCAEFPETGAQVLKALTKSLDLSINDLSKIERMFRNASSFDDLKGDQTA